MKLLEEINKQIHKCVIFQQVKKEVDEDQQPFRTSQSPRQSISTSSVKVNEMPRALDTIHQVFRICDGFTVDQHKLATY